MEQEKEMRLCEDWNVRDRSVGREVKRRDLRREEGREAQWRVREVRVKEGVVGVGLEE